MLNKMINFLLLLHEKFRDTSDKVQSDQKYTQ